MPVFKLLLRMFWMLCRRRKPRQLNSEPTAVAWQVVLCAFGLLYLSHSSFRTIVATEKPREALEVAEALVAFVWVQKTGTLIRKRAVRSAGVLPDRVLLSVSFLVGRNGTSKATAKHSEVCYMCLRRLVPTVPIWHDTCCGMGAPLRSLLSCLTVLALLLCDC